MEQNLIKKVESFLITHATINGFDLLLSDSNGVIRGKRVSKDNLIKSFVEGVLMPGSIFALDITGKDIEETDLQWGQGDPDQLCFPEINTLKPCPWYQKPRGQVLLTMYDKRQNPFFADPRQVLKKVLQLYQSKNLTPVIAVELEFYLVNQNCTNEGQSFFTPLTSKYDTSAQVYSLARLDDYKSFFDDIEHYSTIQDIPAESAVSEASPGQFEINLRHVDNAIIAADHGVLLKRLVKGVARKHGFEATFMAKPFAHLAGNGMHIHFSLQDKEGKNIFNNDQEEGSHFLQNSIGGLLELMSESMAILAPNANSYRRFQNHSYAPTKPTWGYNNRTTAIRIPGGNNEAKRIEYRVAGADANIYLVIAIILAAAYHGIENKINPSKPIQGNSYNNHYQSLPNTWQEALSYFEQSKILATYLGSDFCKFYSTCRHIERNRFRSLVSNHEHNWYLHTL
ncbi:MAG: glutamine synthetase family protein [Alphaproteobacteria bacterium]|nr:glutamine synthetase family protein [Alphaproteobacteria bacterium]